MANQIVADGSGRTYADDLVLYMKSVPYPFEFGLYNTVTYTQAARSEALLDTMEMQRVILKEFPNGELDTARTKDYLVALIPGIVKRFGTTAETFKGSAEDLGQHGVQ